mmetsp:Transcript_17166/g.47247  ORF Transcript_17166/g.47247 Transcript_17166/m.47247 type:complete len:244 (-) Transcript_17166:2314-3045(-)
MLGVDVAQCCLKSGLLSPHQAPHSGMRWNPIQLVVVIRLEKYILCLAQGGIEPCKKPNLALRSNSCIGRESSERQNRANVFRHSRHEQFAVAGLAQVFDLGKHVDCTGVHPGDQCQIQNQESRLPFDKGSSIVLAGLKEFEHICVDGRRISKEEIVLKTYHLNSISVFVQPLRHGRVWPFYRGIDDFSIRDVFDHAASEEGTHEDKSRECNAKKHSRQQIQSKSTNHNGGNNHPFHLVLGLFE